MIAGLDLGWIEQVALVRLHDVVHGEERLILRASAPRMGGPMFVPDGERPGV